jgi:hypothetical protein
MDVTLTPNILQDYNNIDTPPEPLVYQDEIDRQLDVYERGRVLKTIPVEAWQIIKDTIHSYTEDLDAQLRRIQPGDPSVIASQAALYAANELEEKFLQDTEAAMEFSTRPSAELKQYLMHARDSMDVLKQQGA